jgi:hypothetical protein
MKSNENQRTAITITCEHKPFWQILLTREPLLVLLVTVTTSAAYVYLDPVFGEYLNQQVNILLIYVRL